MVLFLNCSHNQLNFPNNHLKFESKLDIKITIEQFLSVQVPPFEGTDVNKFLYNKWQPHDLKNICGINSFLRLFKVKVKILLLTITVDK